MRIDGLLVVVLIVNEDSVLTLKLERQTPVSADADRPMILEFPGQRMKLPSGSVHVARLPGVVEGKQLQAQPARVLRLNPGFRSGAEELLHTPMPEALNHYV